MGLSFESSFVRCAYGTLPSHRNSKDLKVVGGSFSARVPRSSAEVCRVFVHHMVEVEVVGQKEEQQDDQRDGDEEEEVNGEVESVRETHHEMTHGTCV